MTETQQAWQRLGAHLGASVESVERLTGGVSAEVHLLTLRKATGIREQVVLREKATTLPQELLAMRHARSQGLPVPPVTAIPEGLTPSGLPALAMPWVAGTTAIDQAHPEPQLRAMADALVALHQLPTKGLEPLPRLLDPLPELPGFLAVDPAFEPIAAWLSRRPSTPHRGTLALLHGDFWPGNLLWREGSLQAMLDWEDTHLGDPHVDVALTRLELRYLLGSEGTASFTTRYRAQASLDEERLALWDCYVAAAALTYMGSWGLPKDEVAHMRREATAFIHQAGARLAAFG